MASVGRPERIRRSGAGPWTTAPQQVRQAYFGRRVTRMRCCAGMTSSRSDFSSPITCIAPPQQEHDVVSGSITTSIRGRCAGSDLRWPGSDLGRGVVACFSAAACVCALAISRSSSASCSWSGSSRSECRPNCARWNCRMIWRIRSTRRSSSSRSAISASAAARRPGMSPGSASAVVIAARLRPYSGPRHRLCCRRLSGRLRPRDPWYMHPRPVEPFDQGCQLRRRQAHHPVDDRWPFEGALFQPLPHQHQPAAVPYQNLDPVGAAAAEYQQGAVEGILR